MRHSRRGNGCPGLPPSIARWWELSPAQVCKSHALSAIGCITAHSHSARTWPSLANLDMSCDETIAADAPQSRTQAATRETRAQNRRNYGRTTSTAVKRTVRSTRARGYFGLRFSESHAVPLPFCRIHFAANHRSMRDYVRTRIRAYWSEVQAIAATRQLCILNGVVACSSRAGTPLPLRSPRRSANERHFLIFQVLDVSTQKIVLRGRGYFGVRSTRNLWISGGRV